MCIAEEGLVSRCLGELLFKGEYCSRDVHPLTEFFKKGCSVGDAISRRLLDFCCSNGVGAELEFKQAINDAVKASIMNALSIFGTIW